MNNENILYIYCNIIHIYVNLWNLQVNGWTWKCFKWLIHSLYFLPYPVFPDTTHSCFIFPLSPFISPEFYPDTWYPLWLITDFYRYLNVSTHISKNIKIQPPPVGGGGGMSHLCCGSGFLHLKLAPDQWDLGGGYKGRSPKMNGWTVSGFWRCLKSEPPASAPPHPQAPRTSKVWQGAGVQGIKQQATTDTDIWL